MTIHTTRRMRRDRRSATRRRGAAGVVGDALLWIASAGGVVCIALVILAVVADVTLLMFRTGSMSPAIPAGSVAVVQRIPASAVAVGDIVTVDRDPELPVTHRVTSVASGSSEKLRVLTLRGDANEQDDPFPYTVESVRIVRFAVPGVAPLIVAMGSPYVLGGITVGAALLVGWMFWPRERRRPASAVPAQERQP